MNSTYDAIIVGGGIAGISVAYHLVRAGIKTLLFDRQDKGRATDAGAGIISPYTAAPDIGYYSEDLFNLAVAAQEYYPKLMQEVGIKEGDSKIYNQPGTILVQVSEQEAEAFEKFKNILYQRLEKRGLPKEGNVRLLSGTEAQEMFPSLGENQGAIYCSQAAQVDGALFSQELSKVSQQLGLRVESSGVEKLILQDHKVLGVVANGETFTADKVVIAGGAWSPQFEQQCGVKIPVEPERGQIIHLGLGNTNTSHKPILSTLKGYYFLAWPDNRVVVGATREKGSRFVTDTTVAGVHEVLEEALRVAPGLKDATIREIRVGLRPVPRDEIHILGTVPNINNLYLATGLGHSGLAIGPYGSKLVADMMMGKQVEINMEPFNIGRFK